LTGFSDLDLGDFFPLPNVLVAGAVADAADLAGAEYSLIAGVSLANKTNKVFGYVRTVSVEEVVGMDENLSEGLGFLSSMQKGEVLFVRGSMKFAYFGEMMTRLSISLGLGGAVIYGASRDSSYTSQSEFGVASSSFCPIDIKGRGRVDEFDRPLEVNGFLVESGDLLFADSDGVLVIKQRSLSEFFTSLEEVLANEKKLVQRIEGGESVEEILRHHDGF
jgi:regulator of RNase E activity RraA